MKISRQLFLAAAMLCMLTAFAAPALAGAADCTEVATESGPISGEANKNICMYKGVPFAAPPVGELRWALPQKHAAWSEPLQTVEYKGPCMQFPMLGKSETTIEGVEDCLYLNVWQPKEASEKAMPVMVFLHGGGFMHGSGHMDPHDGLRLSAMGDVIVVTINYRLGPFGFMAHPALRDDQGRTGNYGLYDQAAALQWVHDNIANFGGDPDNVTLFGESAGGMSVGMHLISPISKGLFHRAIIESGPILLLNRSVDSVAAAAENAAARAGCGDPATAAQCLRALPAEEVVKKLKGGIVFITDLSDKIPLEPLYGTEFVPDTPYKMFRDGKYADVPIIMGTNKDEASFFVQGRTIKTMEDYQREVDNNAKKLGDSLGLDLFSNDFLTFYDPANFDSPKQAFSELVGDSGFNCSTRMLADLMAANGTTLYLYHFTKVPTPAMADWGAFHGAELPFVFGKFAFLNMKFSTPSNKRASQKIIGLWSSFARDGVPSADDVPAWPKYNATTQPMMELDENMAVLENFKTDRCKVYENILTEAFEK